MYHSLLMSKNKINYPIILFVFIFSFYLQQYHFDGFNFSLKPFMVVAFLLFMYLIWATVYSNEKIIIKAYYYEVVLVVFLIYCFTTLGIAKYASAGIRFVLGMIVYFFIYIIGKLVLQKYSIKQLEQVVKHAGIVFNTVSIILYVIGIYLIDPSISQKQRILGLMFERNTYRLIGTIEDPNFFVLFNSIFFFYYLTRPKDRMNNLGLILCFITVLLSLSRGGLLAVLFPFIFYMVKYVRKYNNKKVLLMLALVLILNIFLIYILNFNLIHVLTERMLNIFSDGGSGRINLWKKGLDLFMKNPIIGIGINNFRYYNINVYGGSHYLHNTYLQVLVETGVVGFVIFSLFLFSFLIRLLKLYWISKDIYLLFAGASISISIFNLSSIINEALLLYMIICSRYLLEYSGEMDNDKRSIIKISYFVDRLKLIFGFKR